MRDYLIKASGAEPTPSDSFQFNEEVSQNRINQIQKEAFHYAKENSSFFRNAAFQKEDILDFLAQFNQAEGVLGIYLSMLKTGQDDQNQLAPMLFPHQGIKDNTAPGVAYISGTTNGTFEINGFEATLELHPYICSEIDENSGPVYAGLDFKYPNSIYFQPTKKVPDRFQDWHEGFQLESAIKNYPEYIVTDEVRLMQGYFGCYILEELFTQTDSDWDQLVLFPIILDVQNKNDDPTMEENAAPPQHYIQYTLGLAKGGQLLPFGNATSPYLIVAGASWPRPWIKTFADGALSKIFQPALNIEGFYSVNT